MKINKIVKKVEVSYYVTTDEEVYPEYRTDGNGNWERLMGQSWEPPTEGKEDSLETIFREEILMRLLFI